MSSHALNRVCRPPHLAAHQAAYSPPHCSLEISPPRSQQPIGLGAFHEWYSPDGTLWTGFYRVGNEYLLRFPGLADFRVSAEGMKISVFPVAGIAEQTIHHLYLNQVLPLALSRQGKFVLHASAVEIADFAIAFLGASGRGKSTLAASFSTSGFRFLTDDGLQLEEIAGMYAIQPSHPSIRLWEDSSRALIPETATPTLPVDYSPKSRFLAGEGVAFCNAPRTLRSIYFLGEEQTEKVSIEPVGGRDAMVELVKNSFLLDIEARDMLTHHFARLAQMAKTPMFFRLDYPRTYNLLPMVREAVIKHATCLNKAENVVACAAM